MEPDIAFVDLNLGQPRLFLGFGEARFEGFAAVACRKQLGLALLQRPGQAADFGLELGAQLAQGGNVLLQTGDLSQLHLDALLVGGDDPRGFVQARLQLGALALG